MKLLVTIFLLVSFSLFAQQIKIETAILTTDGLDWGNDISVINNEPLGSFSGVQKSNGTIYAAVNDTTSTTNLGLVIFQSTNNGSNWSLYPSGISYRGTFDYVKMIRSGLDSIYLTFSVSGGIYFWNFLSGHFNQFPFSNYRAYDLVASSTGNLYIFLDSLPTNHLVRYGSINGGANWSSRGLVTSASAGIKLSISGTGDTLTVNYYGPVLPDTTTSVIRQGRYRETGPGTMATVGSFIDVVTDPVPKKEFMTAFNNGETWFLYTSGADGSRDIMGRKSINSGANYNTAVTLAGNPNRDEYWFDVKFRSGDAGGFDLVYYSDSTQVGPPTNNSDKLLHSFSGYASDVFTNPVSIGETPPNYSAREYSPKLVQIPFTNSDAGVLWVGDLGSSRKLLWDRFLAIVPVELTSFTGSYSNNIVNLSWATATETNNKGFEIERNITGSWEKVGFVSGNGTSTSPVSYSYTDKIVDASVLVVSYRLKQIDFDGTVSYSDPVEVNISLPADYSLGQNYPNPFNPTTKISFNLPEKNHVTIKVYDILGNLVTLLVNETKDAGNHEVVFNAGDLSSGIYLYKMESGAFSSTKKLLLMK